VRRHWEKLERFYERITSCHVTLALPHQHQHTARPVRVSIDLTLPGHEIVVNHARDDDARTHDAHAAVDHAFDQAGRRLHDFVRQQRGDVKTHPTE